MGEAAGVLQTLAIEKAEAPLPEVARDEEVRRAVLWVAHVVRDGGGTRLIMFSMSTVEKAFSEPSAEMPSDCAEALPDRQATREQSRPSWTRASAA